MYPALLLTAGQGLGWGGELELGNVSAWHFAWGSCSPIINRTQGDKVRPLLSHLAEAHGL